MKLIIYTASVESELERPLSLISAALNVCISSRIATIEYAEKSGKASIAFEKASAAKTALMASNAWISSYKLN